MEIDSSSVLGGGCSTPLGPLLLRADPLDGPLMMLSPTDSPSEALTGPSPPVEFESASELSAEGQQSETDSPPEITALTSRSERLSYRGNRQWDNLSGVSPLTHRVMPSGVGAGLINLGLTCFLNAVLQCLTHTVPLVRSLRSWDHANTCDCAGEDFCLLCILREHIEVSLNCSGGIISPMKIVANLNNISPYFQRYQQEDAHEFQQAMLDKLEQCCMDRKRNSNSSSPKNIVDEVFGGRLISKLKCCNCDHCSCTYEPLIDLSLEIEHVETLTSALESFTNVEKIEDPESKFRCQNCNEDVFVEKQLLVEKEPTVAALHLKRFKSDGFNVEKIDKHVPFPLELDLQPFTNVHESNAKLKYQLYAVVVHTGMSPTWGHYFSFIQSSPGIWHKFDDSKVVRVQEEFVLSQDAYILFYAKRETPWFASLMEKWKSAESNLISENYTTSVLDKVDIPCTPYYPAFPTVESSTYHESADNSLSISGPKNVHDKVYSPHTQRPAFSNIMSSTFHETAGAASLYSENCGDMMMNETRVDEDGSNECRDDMRSTGSFIVKEVQSTAGASNAGDYCNDRQDELQMDEKFHPLTPPESPSPESHNIQIKRHSEASSMPTTPQDPGKIEGSSRRKQLSKSVEDPKKKEALRYMKRMPMNRASQLFSAMNKLGPRSPGSKKKATKRRMGASLCERASPSSAQHRSRSNQPLPPPVLDHLFC